MTLSQRRAVRGAQTPRVPLGRRPGLRFGKGAGRTSPGTGVIVGLLVAGCLTANAAAATLVLITMTESGAPASPGVTPHPAVATKTRQQQPTQPVQRTAADDVVVRTIDTAPPTGWIFKGRPETVSVPGLVLPAGCPRALPADAAPFAHAWRDVQHNSTLARITVLAYGAGLGGPAAQAIRSVMAGCRAGLGAAPVTDADGFTLSVPGDPAAAAVVWRRGDVVVVLTGAGPDAATSLATTVAPAVDATLVGALSGRCADRGSSVADAGRNPLSAHPAPFVLQVPVPSPAGPRWQDAGTPTPSPVSLPAATAHPELAPLLPAPAAQWSDQNGDGVLDTPPPLESAARGTVPVFVDPRAFPSTAQESPPAPIRPTAPQPPADRTVEVPAVDATGPGCGWAFTGMPTPVSDSARISEIAARTRWQAAVEAAAAESTYQVEVGAYAPDEIRWRSAMSRWLASQVVAAARTAAIAQATEASAAYAASVRTYLTPPPAADKVPLPPPTTTSPTEQPSVPTR